MKLCGSNSDVLNFQLSDPAFDTVRTIFHMLESYPYKEADSFLAFRENCIVNILLLLSEAFQAQYGKELLAYDPRLMQINHYIQNHLDVPLHCLLDELSNALKLNPQYINRIIKKALALQSASILINAKLKKASSFCIPIYLLLT